MKYSSHYSSPLGNMIMTSDGTALTGLWFEGQKYSGSGHEIASADETLTVFRDTARWLDTYFNGREPDFTPPLDANGTDFRREVWNILLTIPYGHTMTYGEIAGIMARKKGISRMSAQAVGGAVGHNPISIIIPCHRVMGLGGNLTGYGGGIQRKVKLLELENVDTSAFFIPKKGTAL